MKKTVSVLIAVALMVTAIFCLSSCSSNDESFKSLSELQKPPVSSDDPDMFYAQYGEGKTKFTLIVENAYVDFDSKEKYIIKTDKKHLGEALVEVGLVEGEKGQYGLFITKVMGVELDGKTEFWAIYIDGKQASTGADQINVKAGETYTIKREKIK